MKILSGVEKWLTRFKPYFFTYKKGFWEMPYLANSPQVMLEIFKKVPFVKYNAANQSIAVNTPLLKVLFYWMEIEEGLFILSSETKFKANISFKHYYDESLAADYFTLSFRDHDSKNINSIVNDASFPDNSWLLFKPGAKVSHYHFKGTTGKYITVYFTAAWLENYMTSILQESSKGLSAFMNSDRDHLICPHFLGDIRYKEEKIFNLFFQKDQVRDKNYKEELKQETLNVIAFFIGKLQTENIDERHFLVSNKERIQVLQAEQVLKGHLYEKFPGIIFVAKEVGSSETKLKECFKLIYNKTMLQYFHALQMEKAKEVISGTDQLIGSIGTTFGYENPSKFSAAFKDYHGFLPSELRPMR
jgi:AraC-like DNA-binding protein